jgi:hypothetical protein
MTAEGVLAPFRSCIAWGVLRLVPPDGKDPALSGAYACRTASPLRAQAHSGLLTV